MTKEQAKLWRLANRERAKEYDRQRYHHLMRRRMQRKYWKKASAKYRAKKRLI